MLCCFIYNNILLQIVFSHAQGPVDGGKDDEHNGDPPLANKDADFAYVIMFLVVFLQGIHAGLPFPPRVMIRLCKHQL